jgi:hypothetical protein
LHHWHFACRCRRPWCIQGIKQQKPVRTDRQGECLALLLALGQAVILDPVPVPLKPDRLGDPAQPVRHDRGQIVQRRAERLGH